MLGLDGRSGGQKNTARGTDFPYQLLGVLINLRSLLTSPKVLVKLSLNINNLSAWFRGKSIKIV